MGHPTEDYRLGEALAGHPSSWFQLLAQAPQLPKEGNCGPPTGLPASICVPRAGCPRFASYFSALTRGLEAMRPTHLTTRSTSLLLTLLYSELREVCDRITSRRDSPPCPTDCGTATIYPSWRGCDSIAQCFA